MEAQLTGDVAIRAASACPEKHESRGEPRLFDVEIIRAGEPIRTLDPNLGKVVLNVAGCFRERSGV